MGTIERILAIIGALAGISGFVALVIQLYLWIRWKRRITWDDTLRVAGQLLSKIEASNWVPDLVIGLGRSGGLWGGWIAGNLGSRPLAVVDVKYAASERGINADFPAGDDVLSALRKSYHGGTRVLIIEGATTRGQTFEEFFRKFGDMLKDWDVRTAVLYCNPASGAKTDYVGKDDLEPWPTDEKPFPWHHRPVYRPFLARAMRRGMTQKAMPASL